MGKHDKPTERGFGKMKLKPQLSLKADDVLKLHYLPGASGAGRISTVAKAGIQYGHHLTHPSYAAGLITDQQMVASIDFVPSIGSLWSTEDQAGIYSAIFRYYTYVRSKNVSLSSYGVFDLFKAIYGSAQIDMVLAYIRQKIRVASTVGSGVNSAFPQGLLKAYGVTNNDLKNIANDIATYNRIVNAISGLFLPFDFEIGKRSVALAGTIYLDDPVLDKSQLITFRPVYFYKWDLDPASTTVGQIVPVGISTGDTAAMLASLSDVVNMYLADADMNNIFAELRRAFGESEQLRVAPLPLEGEPISVEFSQVLLDQLHNATLVGEIDTTSVRINENTSTGYLEYSGTYIKCHPYITGDMSMFNNKVAVLPNTVFGPAPTYTEKGYAQGYTYLYCHDNQPDEENIGTLLYFKARVGVGHQFTNQLPIYSHGTEILCKVVLHANVDLFERNGSVDPSLPDMYACDEFVNFMGYNTQSTLTSAFFEFVGGVNKYLSFAYLPVFTVVFNDPDGTSDGISFLVEGDIDNRVAIEWKDVASNISATTQYVIGHTFGQD